MLARELTRDYFAEMEARLAGLKLRRGTLMSARLGRAPRARVRAPPPPAHPWLAGPADRQEPGRLQFHVPDRNEAGARALSELTSRAVNDTANALAQSADHIKGFFQLLRAELGFYLGCLNLRDRLLARGLPVCFPVPAPLDPTGSTPRPVRRQSRAHPGRPGHWQRRVSGTTGS